MSFTDQEQIYIVDYYCRTCEIWFDGDEVQRQICPECHGRLHDSEKHMEEEDEE